MQIGSKKKWIVTNPKITLAPQAKLFSISSKGIYDNPSLWKIFEEYTMAGFSLRYSGCAALDINQLFVKKQGVYCMLHTIAHPSRLSLLTNAFQLRSSFRNVVARPLISSETFLTLKLKVISKRLTLFVEAKKMLTTFLRS